MLPVKSTVLFAFVTVFAAKAEFECGIPAFQPITHSTGQRIVGGWEARPHSFPWLTLIKKVMSGENFICGGSLISLQKSNRTDLVLTAGHCLYNVDSSSFLPVENVTVLVGAHDRSTSNDFLRKLNVKTFVNSNFNPRLVENDVLLIQLRQAVPYTKYTRPVCLPKQGETLELHKTCYVSGWGMDSEDGKLSPVLLSTDVKIYDMKDCHYRRRYKEKYICAGALEGGKDSCLGDSGGPLVCENNGVWTQYGIVSFGKGCARPGQAAIYAQVSNYVDWIKAEAEQFEPITNEVYYPPELHTTSFPLQTEGPFEEQVTTIQ